VETFENVAEWWVFAGVVGAVDDVVPGVVVAAEEVRAGPLTGGVAVVVFDVPALPSELFKDQRHVADYARGRAAVQRLLGFQGYGPEYAEIRVPIDIHEGFEVKDLWLRFVDVLEVPEEAFETIRLTFGCGLHWFIMWFGYVGWCVPSWLVKFNVVCRVLACVIPCAVGPVLIAALSTVDTLNT